jgi:hypothetical protein
MTYQVMDPPERRRKYAQLRRRSRPAAEIHAAEIHAAEIQGMP